MLQDYFPRTAGVSSVDASFHVRPSAAEPPIAAARATMATLQRLLDDYTTVVLSEPGIYWVADADGDDRGIVLGNGGTSVLVLAPGVDLRRHSGYSSASPGFGWLLGTPGTASRPTRVVIRGGGRIGRAAASGSDNQSTVCLTNCDQVIIEDIEFYTLGNSGKYCVITSDIEHLVVRNVQFSGDYNSADNNLTAGWSTKSDGLHCTGYHGKVEVTNVSGSTGDNMVAVGTDEGINNVYDYFPTNRGARSGSVRISVDKCRFFRSSEPYRQFGRKLTLNLTGVAWDATARTLTKTNAFAGLRLGGSVLNITGGTGVTTGEYAVLEQVSDSVVRLASSIKGSAASDVTVDVCHVYVRSRLRDFAGSLLQDTFHGGAGGVGCISTIDDDVGGAGLIACRHEIEIDGVDVVNGTAGYPLVKLGGTALQWARVQDVRVPAGVPGVLVTSGTTGIKDIRIVGVVKHGEAGAQYLVYVASPPESLILKDLYLGLTSTGTATLLQLDAAASALAVFPRVIADNLTLRAAGTGGVFISQSGNGQAQVLDGFVSHAVKYGGAGLINGPASSGAGANKRSNWRMTGLAVEDSTGTVLLSGQVDLRAGGTSRVNSGTLTWCASSLSDRPSVAFEPEVIQLTLGYADFQTHGVEAGVGPFTVDLNLNNITRFAGRFVNTRGRNFRVIREETWGAFTGGTIIAATIEFGVMVGSTWTAIVGSAQSVFTTTTNYWAPTTNATASISSASQDRSPAIRLTLTGGNKAALTSGILVVTIELSGGISSVA